MAEKNLKENDLVNATGGNDIQDGEIVLYCDSCGYKTRMKEEDYMKLEDRSLCPKCFEHTFTNMTTKKIKMPF